MKGKECSAVSVPEIDQNRRLRRIQRGRMGITREYVGNMADQAPFSND